MNEYLSKQRMDAIRVFVRNTLMKNGGETNLRGNQLFRSRSRHIERVLLWSQKLMACEPGIQANSDVVCLGALFHDAGYNDQGIPHEELGQTLFLQYAREQRIPEPLIQPVSDIIRLHSRKEELANPLTPIERIIVMESDLLDEEGAMGIVIDCLTFGSINSSLIEEYYPALLEHLCRYSGEILRYQPMVTQYAATCWRKKQQLVNSFLSSLDMDLCPSTKSMGLSQISASGTVTAQ